MKNTEESNVRTRGFGLRRDILPLLAENYKSQFIEEMKAHGFRWCSGRLTFYLAKEFGFCYGVDKAIDFAYETRAQFPDRDIYITSEIIHNPLVNRKLIEMGIQFLSGQYKGAKGVAELGEKDIVLLPAFGTTVKELEYLKSKKCLLVDTTCNSVVAVWKRVEKYTEDGFTAVIHGKYDHEETQATSSRASKYLVVWDKSEAQAICDYIVDSTAEDDPGLPGVSGAVPARGFMPQAGGGEAKRSRPLTDRVAFLKRFEKAVSPGFDPDRDLIKIGCANQTTMMSSESLEIANMLQEGMEKKYGASGLAQHFRHFDTICSATQERQDAILDLLKNEKIDLVIVIGGYNSSNTTHLAEIAMKFNTPNYHIKDAEGILSKHEIEHKPLGSKTTTAVSSWLPEGPVTIAVTAGASTPNRVIEEVIRRISVVAG